MKKHGSVSDYIESRNENLKREFIARLGRNGRSISESIAAMTMVPADRFYISEERAVSAVRRLKEGAPEKRNENPQRKAMIKEIFRRVEALMAARPGLSLTDAVYEVVNSPAPGFYLARGSMRTLLYSLLGTRRS